MGRKKLGAVEEEVLETPEKESVVEETTTMRWNSDCLEFGIYA